MHPAKIQISLHIRTVWSNFSLETFWIAKDEKSLHADKEDRPVCVVAQGEASLRLAHKSE